MSEPTVDPVHGVRYTFEQEGDELLTVDTWMRDGGGLPKHYHPCRRRSGGWWTARCGFTWTASGGRCAPPTGRSSSRPAPCTGSRTRSAEAHLGGGAPADGPAGVSGGQRPRGSRGPVHEGRHPEKLARREVGGRFLARHEGQTVMTFPPRFAQKMMKPLARLDG